MSQAWEFLHETQNSVDLDEANGKHQEFRRVRARPEFLTKLHDDCDWPYSRIAEVMGLGDSTISNWVREDSAPLHAERHAELVFNEIMKADAEKQKAKTAHRIMILTIQEKNVHTLVAVAHSLGEQAMVLEDLEGSLSDQKLER